MKIDKIKTGDVVVFERGEETLHGKVTSIGSRYIISPFMSTDETILFVRVIEHPEWKGITVTAREVKEVIVLGVKVQFS
jgi:hypothetical protein